MKNWKVRYNGWIITHDPMGKLACYREGGNVLEWCYFGSTMDEIKSKIDEREYIARLGADC